MKWTIELKKFTKKIFSFSKIVFDWDIKEKQNGFES